MLPPARWVFHLGLRTYTIATELDDLDDVSGASIPSAVSQSHRLSLSLNDFARLSLSGSPSLRFLSVSVSHLLCLYQVIWRPRRLTCLPLDA